MKRVNNSHTTTRSSSASSTLHTILLATCFLTATKEAEAAETTSLVKQEKNRDFFNVKLVSVELTLQMWLER